MKKKMPKDPFDRERALFKLSDARNARGDEVGMRVRFEEESAVALMNKKSKKAARRIDTTRSLDFTWGDGNRSGIGAKLLAVGIALALTAAVVFLFVLR